MPITLERAIALATEAHAGQQDKDGAPYILHPLRVMQRQRDVESMIVAVCHDILEDAPEWNESRLMREGFTPRMLAALSALTKRAGEEYAAFIRRTLEDRIAIRVKRADLIDNLDLTRLKTVLPEDIARMDKYKRALAMIDDVIERDSHALLRPEHEARREINPQDFQHLLRRNQRREMAQSLLSPKIVWPEE